MRKLILLRHGESEHHLKGLTGGWTDTPLTERGRKQAEQIGRNLVAFDENRRYVLFSSDLLRARQTTEIVAKYLNVRPIFSPELRELNNGEAKGRTAEDARRIKLPVTEPTVDWVPYPGAESWKTMSLRVIRFMDSISCHSSDESLIIISHGNAGVAIIHWWLGLGEEFWSRISFELDCGSITQLTENRWGERVVAKLNDTAHLIK